MGGCTKTSPHPQALAAARRTRFSLRLLLLAVGAVAVGIGIWTRQARIERDARRAVAEAGGWVVCDYQYDEEGAFHSAAEITAPRMLVRCLGEASFSHAESVHFRGRDQRLSDEQLAVVSRLPHLRRLTAIADREAGVPRITDRGLAALANCRTLEILILENTAASDDGVAALSRLPNLKALRVAGGGITDAALAHFAEMTQLQRLGTSGTSITLDGVERLRELLPNCEVSGPRPPPPGE